jgi:hypothetical protein
VAQYNVFNIVKLHLNLHQRALGEMSYAKLEKKHLENVFETNNIVMDTKQ